MDTYPGDLLAGVFPLVFAVDSILPASTKIHDEESEGDGDTDQQNLQLQRLPSSSRRSLFDRFLDSMASHLVDNQNDPSNLHRPSPSASTMRRSTDTFTSLLRTADDNGENDSSGEEEDYSTNVSESGSNSRRFRVALSTSSLGMGTSYTSGGPLSPRSTPPSTAMTDNNSLHSNSVNNGNTNNTNANSSNTNNNNSINTNTDSTAYAKHLKVDVFFERARIHSISTKHGFPPSKDPSGQSNRALKLSQARAALTMNPTNANALRLKRVLDQYPMADGLLPCGWLEKHAAALPSVLLVVTSFQIHDLAAQADQDAYLKETVTHLRESLATKRDCSIRLVCLADTGDDSSPTTPAKVDEWISRMKRECQLLQPMTMLRIPHDLESATPGDYNNDFTTPMQNLHKQVRDASWLYYQTLCRRVKRKLHMLGHDHQPTLLPMAVRYCFKIGVFYEFLLKHGKALKYFSNSYRHLQSYYRHLQQGNHTISSSLVWNPSSGSSTNTPSQVVNPQSDDGAGIETALDNSNTGHDPFDDRPVDGEDAGVEVALADAADDEDDDDEEDDDDDDDVREQRQKGSSPPPPRALVTTIPLDIRKIFTEINPPFDMVCQCRTVADWLNFKLVHAGLQAASISDDDHGLLAAAAQWRRHVQVFLSRRDNQDIDTSNSNSSPAWSYWRYLAQQRHVMSQLVERFPPRRITSLSDGQAKDDVLARCNAWRNYMAAAEAQLRLGVEVQKAMLSIDQMKVPSGADNLRGRFVGGLDSDGLVPLLQEEALKSHVGECAFVSLLICLEMKRTERERSYQYLRNPYMYAFYLFNQLSYEFTAFRCTIKILRWVCSQELLADTSMKLHSNKPRKKMRVKMMTKKRKRSSLVVLVQDSTILLAASCWARSNTRKPSSTWRRLSNTPKDGRAWNS